MTACCSEVFSVDHGLHERPGAAFGGVAFTDGDQHLDR
jgi:hypothetical protein